MRLVLADGSAQVGREACFEALDERGLAATLEQLGRLRPVHELLRDRKDKRDLDFGGQRVALLVAQGRGELAHLRRNGLVRAGGYIHQVANVEPQAAGDLTQRQLARIAGAVLVDADSDARERVTDVEVEEVVGRHHGDVAVRDGLELLRVLRLRVLGHQRAAKSPLAQRFLSLLLHWRRRFRLHDGLTREGDAELHQRGTCDGDTPVGERLDAVQVFGGAPRLEEQLARRNRGVSVLPSRACDLASAVGRLGQLPPPLERGAAWAAVPDKDALKRRERARPMLAAQLGRALNQGTVVLAQVGAVGPRRKD
mmetsp:Transcript_10142/g.32237  ORF Transcript_10142/g.32237 Transcript_10142/m.32237 type:complete len:311 (+) Transcript_10142:762-1694(+)